jgi:hypothetical protein
MKPLIVNIGKADEPNANGRVYPRHELERAILDINQDSITRGRVFGQVGMPQGSHCSAELDKISHICGNFNILDDGSVMCEVVWLNTDAGNKAKALYEKGPAPWFFRPAGIGKVRNANGVTEIFDYRILSINMVLNGA